MIVNKKLLSNIVLVSGIAFILLSSLIILCSRSIISNLLLNKSKEQLVLIRDLKQQQLEKFFVDLKKHAELLANDQTIYTSTQEFKDAFEQLIQDNHKEPNQLNSINLDIAQHYNNILRQYKEHSEYKELKDKIDFSVFLQNLNPYSVLLQTKYMTHTNNQQLDVGIYNTVHDKYHSFFQKIIDEYKYHDLLLLDLNGNVIYSTKKNIDFASSVISGAFSSTELANVFNAAKYIRPTEEQVIMSNFSEYLPDYQEPILFTATKIKNAGILVTSVGLSTIYSILQVPEKQKDTSVYLIDQDLRLITNNFGQSTNTLAAREAANGKKGFIEGFNRYKKLALSYFTPVGYGGLSLIVEKNKQAVLEDITKSIINMLIFTCIIIPILLFFVYTIFCLCVEKVDNSLGKINNFMQFVLAKKDLNSRISLKYSDHDGLADILNNMLSWFQNTIDQVAFKIKQFITKYNDLFNSVTDLSTIVQDKKPLIEEAKISAENLVKNQQQLYSNLEKHFNNVNHHKNNCLTLTNLHSEFNNIQKGKDTNLTSSVEYILNICNMADMLTLHLSLEASKNENNANNSNNTGTPNQDNNFLLLSQEIKNMISNLKSHLMQIKATFDDYISEHEHIRTFIAELREKLKPVTNNLEELLAQQKTLLSTSDNAKLIVDNLHNNLIELETKYQTVTKQFGSLLSHNNQLNVELKTDDDYYPFKIVENKDN